MASHTKNPAARARGVSEIDHAGRLICSEYSGPPIKYQICGEHSRERGNSSEHGKAVLP